MACTEGGSVLAHPSTDQCLAELFFLPEWLCWIQKLIYPPPYQETDFCLSSELEGPVTVPPSVHPSHESRLVSLPPYLGTEVALRGTKWGRADLLWSLPQVACVEEVSPEVQAQ